VRRIALYSHDAQGLGHLRRNLSIARALADAEPSSILLIAGAKEAALFGLPRGTDTLVLPALRKDPAGGYHARSIALDLPGIVALRAQILRSALVAFEPDVLIVDKLPSGVEGELNLSFEALHDMGTRLVLGLRDVLDDPVTTRRDWDRCDFERVLRDHYDAVWVYGDPRVYDAALEYEIPFDLAVKFSYSGYIDRQAGSTDRAARADRRRTELGFSSKSRICLCLVGGGEDGYPLAAAFARAELPPGSLGVIVAGPFMPAVEHAAVQALADKRTDLIVLRFVDDPGPLLWLADQVVAMGGYNTTSEILACRKRALIVPRVRPRREQLIRAERLASLGALDVLPPHRLTAEALTDWLAHDPRVPGQTGFPIDLGGLARLPEMLEDVLTLDRAAPAERKVA
jgi:predicted glycosyltransferase